MIIIRRAVRRMGEILKEIEPKQGARTDREPRAGDHPKLQTRASVAESAGLSPRQAKEAIQTRARSSDPRRATALRRRHVVRSAAIRGARSEQRVPHGAAQVFSRASVRSAACRTR